MKKGKVITSSVLASAMVVASIMPAFAYTKEETVYSQLKTNGSEKTTIVSEHLKNDGNEKTIEDLTTLSDILNVNGEEKYTQDGEKITWDAKGNDIYYQGKTDKKLPISMKVTYKLNGKETTVKKMLGKKGSVEINIEYTNNEKQVVDGEELYVPFVVVTGTMIPTDKNSQVEVSNGKVVSNGSNNIVVALAAPGLAEDYNNNEELKDLNKVTIKYETKKFELSSMMSVATPSLLSEDDMDIFNEVDDIYAMVDQLSSSYAQIVSGGKTLQAGINEFASKYGEFDNGMKSLNEGIDSVYNGSQQLTSGLTDLNTALNTLDSNSAMLNNGAKQTFEALLSTANSQLAPALQQAGIPMNTLTIDNYKTELNSVLTAIGGATTQQVTEEVKKQVTAEVTRQADLKVEQTVEATIKEQVKAGLIQNIVAGALTSKGIPQMSEEQAKAFIENDENGKAVLENQYQSTLQGMKSNGTFDQYVENAKKDGTYQTTLSTMIQQTMESADIQAKIKQLVEQYTSGDKTSSYMQVYNLLVQLETYNQFYIGVQQYTAAVGQIKDGSKTALDGSKQLTEGISQLKVGAATLVGASAQLRDATGQLKDGTNQLVSGMVQFDEQGIAKITGFINGDLKNDVDKTEKLMNLSKEYKTFTEAKEDVESSTKFIMIINSQKKK